MDKVAIFIFLKFPAQAALQISCGNTTVRFDSPSERNCAPQLSLHPKSLVPVKHREFLSPNVEVFGLVAIWHPMRWCSSSALRISIADPFPKDARCGQLARRLLSNSLARKFTREMGAPALSPRLSILRACSARISSLGGMCLVSLSAVCLGGVEVRRSQCPHWLGALRTRTPRHSQQLRRLFQRKLLVHPLFWGEVGDLRA